MKITEKPTNNPSSKARFIDIYDNISSFISYIFYDRNNVSIEGQIDQILPLLVKIGDSPKQRIRNSSFSVWGSIFQNDDGMRLYSISIPDRIRHEITDIFFESFSDKSDYCEVNITSETNVRDRGFPLVRYDQGKIIIYVKSFDETKFYHPKIPIKNNIEYRFNRMREKVDRRKIANYSIFEKLFDYVGPERLDMRAWSNVKRAALKVVSIFKHPIIGTPSYQFFKNVIRRNFNFKVEEVEGYQIKGYGITFCDLPDSNRRVGVNILLSKDLENKMKLVILCHEFCHAILHFPVNYADKIIEKMSWSIPEIEVPYQRIKDLRLRSNELYKLEKNADLFTSRFLVPEFTEEFPNTIFTSPNWNLQDYLLNGLLFHFPNEKNRVNKEGFVGLKKEVARIMSLQKLQTIYERLAHSTLRRSKIIQVSSGYNMEDLGVEVIINLFKERFTELHRKTVKAYPKNYDENDEKWDYDNKFGLIRKILASNRLNVNKLAKWKSPLRKSLSVIDMITPLNWKDDNDVFPRIPLIPDKTNTGKDPKGKWLSLQKAKTSPAWTVSEWQEFSESKFVVPPGLILYDPFWIYGRG